MARMIDMTPTWEQITPPMLLVMTDGTEEGREHIRPEFARMATLADERNAMAPKIAAALEALEHVAEMHASDPDYVTRADALDAITEAVAALKGEAS